MPLEILGRIAGLDAPLSPADGFDACGRALLAARVAALGIACLGTRSKSATRWHIEGPALVATFAASLVLRVAFLPFLFVAVVSSAYAGRWRGAWVAVVALVAAGALASPSATEPDAVLSPLEHNPAGEVLRWADNDNAYRVRFWAAQWAARERVPGAGHLALAGAYRALGHDDEARRVATRVAEDGESPAREDAAALLRSWTAGGSPGAP
jgi:FimV-like protein